MGHSLTLPIAMLPITGLLLDIGSSFTNATIIQAYGLERILGDKTMLNAPLVIMTKTGNVVFDSLPIIFTVGVAIGMVKAGKEVAALSAMIAFFIMHVSINTVLIITGKILPDGTIAPDVLDDTIASTCGIQTLRMGVLEGIIMGLGVAALHNRYHKIALPNAISFFGGSRLVPIIFTAAYVGVGMAMYFIWSVVQNAIFALGGLVTGTGYVGILISGTIKRALVPFGFRHVFYMPFWQTAVGGTMMMDGNLIQGGQNVFFVQLASPDVIRFSTGATGYFSGELIFMIFGLLGAAPAMYRSAKPEEKKVAGGLLLSAALASMLTGATEPIGFSFLSVALTPFAVQVVLVDSAYMIVHILNIVVGLTFSGDSLGLLIFGILQGNEKTSQMRTIPVGVTYFLLYYFIFSSLIKGFDLKTPGGEDKDEEIKLYARADVNARKPADTARVTGPANEEDGGNGDRGAPDTDIARGLGGKRNITSVDCCATRLRCSADSPALVDERLLKTTGIVGVIKRGQGIQVIYGLNTTVIESDLGQYLAQVPDEALEEDAESCQKKHIICSPFNGKVVSITETPDEALSSKVMDDGYMVISAGRQVLTPEDEEVLSVFPSKHTTGLKTGDDMECLLHTGVDAVELDGGGSKTSVKGGQKVKRGQKSMEFDLEYIRADTVSEVCMTVSTSLTEGREIYMVKAGEVQVLDETG